MAEAYYRLVPGAFWLTVSIDGYFIGEAEDGEITHAEQAETVIPSQETTPAEDSAVKAEEETS